MMDTCANTHALRTFEHNEAEQERRTIDAEDAVAWKFWLDMADQNRAAEIIEQYEVDLTPVLALIFKPLAHPDLASGRISEIRSRVRDCFHRHIADQLAKELGE